MSLSVTVSGDDTPTVVVAETPGVATDFTTNFAPALNAQTAALANFEARVAAFSGTVSNQLSGITGATGILNTAIASNDSDISAIQTSTGVSDQKITTISGDLDSLRGIANNTQNLVAISTSNSTSINTLSASNNLLVTKTDTISGFITGSGSVLDQISGITGSTGSFAVTGSNVTFGDVTVSGSILPENANASLGNPTNKFRDIHLSSNSIFLGDSIISFGGTPSGASGGLRVLAAGLSGRLVDNTETGLFTTSGSNATFENLTISGSLLPENTGASIGSPSGRFKDLHLSEDSIFLGNSKISFSGGASGGLIITGSGITGAGGSAKNITLLGQDEEGRIAVSNSIFSNSIEVGRTFFLGDTFADSNIITKGPGPVTYTFNTHTNGFKFIDGDGGGGDLITVPHPFINSDGSRNQIGLTDTAVQGGFFTTSGIQRSANGDVDTAYLFPENDTLSLRTSGVERLNINKSGKLGIGTGKHASRLVHIKTNTTDDDGQHPLRVEGASSSIIELKAGDNTSFVGIDFSDNAAPHPGSIIYNHTNNSMAFDTNDATRMTISDSGHVIITGDLTVASGINIGTQPVLTSGQTQTNIDTAVANLVDSAPSTLNTLNELAAALGDDANFSTTTATSLGNLTTATGLLNTNVNTVSGLITSNDSDISALNTATGLLTGATGALSTATGVLQGVTGSFAQTGADVNFQNLTVNNNISLSGNIIDLDGNEIIEIQTNDVIFNGKHLQADFGVGIRHNRGTVKGMDNGATSANLGLYCNSIEAITIRNNGNVGIGTGAPSAPLHVIGSGIVTSDFAVDTNTLFVDASSNRVGINTSSPQTNFHVDGDNIRFENAGEKSLDFDHGGYIYKVGDIDGGETQSHLEINSQAQYVRFLNPGAVGINSTPVGTTNKLQVFGPSLLSGNVNVTGSILSTGTITSTSTVARPVQNDETDSTPIRNIRNITNAAYTGLTGSSSEDANTLYIIVG